jgi:uncharacterized protein DUF4157
MSTYARTRRHRTSPVAADDEKSRLAQLSPTSDQESSATLNDPGYNFGQIAVQPAPAMEPQTKLRVSQPGDAHEQEADQVADTVLRMPEVDTSAASGDTTATHAMASQSSAHEAIPGSDGQPLDAATRAYMEPRFGHDFGHVRVHTDEQAAQAASDFQARAYTVGSDIVFGAEQYAPTTTAGQHLLAHELTHVVQQGGDTAAASTVQREPEVAGPLSLPKDLPDVAGGAQGAKMGAANMDDDNLAIGVIGAQKAILTGWTTALHDFFVVMESKSDKEASPQIFKSMAKFLTEESLGKVGEYFGIITKVGEVVINPLDEGYKALKAFVEEADRIKEAEESATLRNFFTRHNKALGNMSMAVDRGQGAFLQIVRNTSDAMLRSVDTKKGAGVEALSKATDNYTTMREALNNAYTELQYRAVASTPENIFRVLSSEWISNSTIAGTWGVQGRIEIRLNKDFSVKNAYIRAPGGQKLAEQMMRDAADSHQEGVDLYHMDVKKEVQYYGDDGGYPSAYVKLDEDNHIYDYVRGDEGAARVWEHIMKHGARALMANKIEGD